MAIDSAVVYASAAGLQPRSCRLAGIGTSPLAAAHVVQVRTIPLDARAKTADWDLHVHAGSGCMPCRGTYPDGACKRWLIELLRRIWEHQDVLENMQSRLEQTPDAMRTQICTVEHPFDTIKV